ncbi:MAG: hypothetical protein HOH61_01415 [Rhodospirillaceae bacterium]|nr:hypothetical protein [Rhodospirillaceae bacterium]
MGPLPDGTCCRTIPTCTPRRSLRAMRGLWVRWATALTIGFLAVIIAFDGGTLFMPGPMTDGHSSLTTCSDCHTSVKSGPFGWMHSVFADIRPGEDSKACLTCHVVGVNSGKAHGLAGDKSAKMGRMIAARAGGKPHPMSARIQKSMFPMDRFVKNDISCATCHVEHKGRTSDLKAMTDAECQSCHTAQFASFSSGHPEFSNYPYTRRTRIIFDHNAHISVHFPKAGAKNDPAIKPPESCADCHELGPNRRLMATKSFDQTCSACHVNQITGAERASGPRGVPFLTIPGLDVETLRDRKIAIGEWPEDSEAELTPFMVMLLSADPSFKDDLALLGTRDLLDLTDASDAEIAAVERLAWGVKSLLFEMSTEDPARLKERLTAAKGSGDIPISRLIAALPRDVLMGARRDWMPNLAQEIADHAAGRRVLIPVAPDIEKFANALADPPSSAPSSPPAKDDVLSGGGDDKSDILSGGGGDKSGILSGGDKSGILSGGDNKPAILSDDKSDILSGGDDKSDILSGGDDKSDILSGDSNAVETIKVEAVAPPARVEPEVDAEKFARLGGWYRRDYGILFHPTGHVDRFLVSWLDYAGRTAKANGPGAAVFKSLTGKNAQGSCAKCHSVDERPDGSKQVNWGPRAIGQVHDRLTAFSHAPHFGVVGAKGCLTCHQIDDKAKYQASYAQPDPKKIASNFSPLPRAVCTDCHNAKFAGETCLTCHNYHAGRIETPFLTTKIPDHKR